MSANFRVALDGQSVQFRFQTVSFAGIRDLATADFLQELDGRAKIAENLADLADLEAATANLLYNDGQTDAEPVDVQTYLRNMPIYAVAYGVVPDGTDVSAKWESVKAAAKATGRRIILPPGTLRMDSSEPDYLTDEVPGFSSFRRGLRISGAGSGRTVIDSRVASGWWLDISVGDGNGGEYDFASYRGVYGGYLEGVTIRNGAATTASNGVRLRSALQFQFRDVHVFGLSGTAFKLKCLLGDKDASNQVSWLGCRAENNGGWGADVGTDAGVNENSFSSFHGCFFQNNGTAEQKAITGISKANPGVVTCVGHGFTTGDSILIAGVAGMTEVNSYTAETAYTVTVLTADTFSIGVNTSSYTTYTSGGYAIPRVAASGGVRVKGQITSFYGCGWTINKNRSVYIDGEGGGLPQDVFFTASTIENPQMIGLHVSGNRTLIANGLHIYTNGAQAGAPVYWGHLYDGTTAAVSDIRINGACVRTTNHSGEANLTIAQAIGASCNRNSIRWDTQSLHIKQFGYSGQVLFQGIYQDIIPQECEVVVASATSILIRPSPDAPLGNTMPLRVTYGGASGATFAGGPWIATRVASAGEALSNATASASKIYYIYRFTENSGVNTPQYELSETAPVLDAGYLVKTGETHKLCVCNQFGVPVRVQTDGSSQFVTTNRGWLSPIAVPGGGLMWYNETDRKMYYKTTRTLPGAATSGDYSYWPKFETSVAYDPPSLAAGASTTVDVTVTCGAGDYCSGVAFSLGWGGLVAYGSVKAANTVTVYILNPTGSTIDLGSGNLRVAVQRR